MIEAYQELLKQAHLDRKKIKHKVSKLKRLKKGVVDKQIHQLHDEAFEKIDCLKCANCCKTTGPRLTGKDISRIAKSKGMKAMGFIDQFLKVDEEYDYIFKSMPCVFLADDHYCNIYDDRPKACQGYPHTDRVNQLGILALTEKNAQICPAVAYIFKELI